jgi:hypothetical protein
MGLWVSALLHQIGDRGAKDESRKYPQRNYAIFLDEDQSLRASDPLPSVDEITYFVGSIVSVGELAPQSCIMAIAYLSRIRAKLHIHLLNWRRVVLSTLILGCKVWEEHPVFNTDFNELFPEMSGKLLGQLEKYLLNLLRFNVGLTGAEYAKYYFELRDMSPAAFAAHDNPLTDDEIQRLEERSSDAARWQPQQRTPAASQSANYGSSQQKKKRGELVVEQAPTDPNSLVKQASSKLGRWGGQPDASAADDSLKLPSGGHDDDDDDDDDDEDDEAAEESFSEEEDDD